MEDQYGNYGTMHTEEHSPVRKKDSDLATASMIFGIAGIVLSCTCCLGIPASSLALIMGLISRTEPEFEQNARTGVIAGSIGLAMSFAFIILWLIVISFAG